ncbi:MAG: hypothetical protein V2I33_25305 [Kangiellaceae bacterium]|jgi:metal-responsive CopG/Arc/MetJ family transcriptional regulator|nr:hypothetical protein [Kangiellaceae bacterium]
MSGSASKNVKRITISVPSDVLEDIDSLCSSIGVSRSALMTEFMRPTIQQVKPMIDMVLTGIESQLKERNPAKVREILHSMIDTQAQKAATDAHHLIDKGISDDIFKH